MTPREVICRAMAVVAFKRAHGFYEPQKEARWVEKNWPDFDGPARSLLHDLKDQRPHVLDEGGITNEQFNRVIDAMTRS